MKKNILTIILVLSTISLCLNTQKAIGVNIFKKNLVESQQLSSKLKYFDENKNREYYINKYLPELQNEYNEQKFNKKFQKAYKTLEEISEITDVLYGENSIESALIDLQEVQGYLESYNTKKAEETLKKSEELITKLNNNQLKFKLIEKKYDTYFQKGDYFNALKVLDEYKSNPNLSLENRINLNKKFFWTYSSIRDLKEAEKYLNIYYELVEKKYGNNKEKLIEYYNDYAYLVYDKSDYSKVLGLCKKINTLKKSINEPLATDVEFNKNRTLFTYYLGIYDIKNAKRILNLNKEIALKDETRMKREVYAENLVSYYIHLKEYDKAKDALEERISNHNYHQVPRSIFVNDVGQSLFIDSTKAFFYQDIKEDGKAAKEAVSLLKEYKEYKESLFDSYSILYYVAAKSFCRDNNIEKALEYLDTAKKEIAKMYPEDSIHYSNIYAIQGEINENLKNYQEAIKNYQRYAEIISKNLNTSSRDLLFPYSRISYAYAKLNDYDNAILYANKAIAVGKKLYGSNNVKLYHLYLSKADIYNTFEKYQETKKILSKISIAKNNGLIQGFYMEFNFDYNRHMAEQFLRDNNIDEALKYAQIAEEYAIDEIQKEAYKKLIEKIEK